MARNRAALTRAGTAAALVVGFVVFEHGLFDVRSLLRVLLLVAAGLAGVAGIRALVDGIFGQIADQRLLLWRNLATWSLYALLVVVVAPEAGLNVSGLLLGGAVLGVIAASASQAPLGNFFAGLVLLVGRPFAIGDTIRLRSSIAGGAEYEGTVVDARAFYTTLVNADGQLLRLPNSAVLSSVAVVGGAPLQAELELQLPEGARIDPLRRRLEASLPEGSVLEIEARSLDAAARRLLCSVRVRSRLAVSDHEVAEALLDAVAA